ncbi:MAG: hypothetical protein IPO08_23035 [Xanthomonadales bacterium]|nr:hypothetical protein [Xanthomonadales bacterium]
MSYCRFSSMDGRCEVYCYEPVYGGFVTHVAVNRVTFKSDLPPEVTFGPEHCEAWLARHRVVSAMLAEAKRTSIGLPHDGETLQDEDAAAAADRLEYLKGLGYIVPQEAIDCLRDETREAA